MTNRTVPSETGSINDGIISANREVRGFNVWSPESEVYGSHPVNEVILPEVVSRAIGKTKEVGGVW